MKSLDDKVVKHQRSLTAVNCFFFAGVACIAPFLSVHMRSLGLSTIRDVISVHVTSGLTCCFVPVLIIATAERFPLCSPKRRTITGGTSLYKICICFSLVTAAALYSSLLAVPRVVRVPRQPLLDFDCTSASQVNDLGSSLVPAAIRLEKCANWGTCEEAAQSWSADTSFRISHCKQRCNSGTQSNISFHINPLHICVRFHAPDVMSGKSEESSSGRILKRSKRERSMHTCFVYNPELAEDSVIEFTANINDWRFAEFRNVSISRFLSLDSRVPPYTIDVCAFTPTSLNDGSILIHGTYYDAIFCRPPPSVVTCSVRCMLTPVSNAKVNKYTKIRTCHEIVGRPEDTFWPYLIIRSIADASLLSALCLLNVIFLKAEGSRNRVYGKSFVWPAAIYTVLPPFIGIMVDYYGSWDPDKPDYSPAFLVSAAFQFTACALVILFQLPVGASGRYIVSSANEDKSKRWCSKLEIVFTATVVVLLGSFWGFGQVFSSWLFQDLGYDHWMLGLGETLSFGCGFFLLVLSSPLLHNVGDANLVASAFAFHAIRLAGLSFLSEPSMSEWWWPLPFEAMKAMTLPVAWVSMCSWAARALHADTKGRKVALHHLLAILHFGIGRMLGVLTGGFLAESQGFSVAFRSSAVIGLLASFVTLSLHHLYFRPKQKVLIETRNRELQRLSVGDAPDGTSFRVPAMNGYPGLSNTGRGDEPLIPTKN